MADAQPNLQAEYDEAFIVPFASHLWKSARGRSHWVDLEGWQDSMAGPLSAIASTGGCEYVYARDDEYFSVVTDPPSLRSRLLECHAGLASGVKGFMAATPAEVADLEYMEAVVRRMQELIERACAVEHARWWAARLGGAP